MHVPNTVTDSRSKVIAEPAWRIRRGASGRTPGPAGNVVTWFSAFLLAGMASPAAAQVPPFPEIEPNDSKALATPVAGITCGGSLTGTAGAALFSDPDYFRVQTAPLAPGIYRHTLSLSSASPSYSASLQGSLQIPGFPAPWDVAIQSSSVSTPPGMCVWYGFGRGTEAIHYRVHGPPAAAQPYAAVLNCAPVTVVDFGIYGTPGIAASVRIETTGLTADPTEIWIYDEDFNVLPVYGNDDEPVPGTTSQSSLTRNFPPGVYYVALARDDLLNDQAEAPDDRSVTGPRLDFAGVVVASAAAPGSNLTVRLTDGVVTNVFPLTTTQDFEVVWGQFTVAGTTPPPDYETNDAEASLDVNGHWNSSQGQELLVSIACVGIPATVNVGSSLAGNLHDIWAVAAPLVPAAVVLPGGQVINLDLGHPTLTSLYAGSLVPFPGAYNPPPFPAGGYSIPFTLQTPVILSGQMWILNAANPGGVTVSQGVMICTNFGTTVTQSAGDNKSVEYNFANSTLCAYPRYYGMVRTTFWVTSNGRIFLDSKPKLDDETPGTQDLLYPHPWAGFWTDLDPSASGASVVTRLEDVNGHNRIQVTWTDVPYFGNPEICTSAPIPTRNTFIVQIDDLGVVEISGLQGIACNAGGLGYQPKSDSLQGQTGRAQFLGISPGLVKPNLFVPSSFVVGPSGTSGLAPFLDFWNGTGSQGRISLPSALVGVRFTPVYATSGAFMHYQVTGFD